jgi:DNA-binding NtrC family response regulator
MALPRILIAEDEEPLRRLIGMLLANAGYRITLVGDGEEARDKLKAGSFDLVITDLNMPRVDGMTLVRDIQDEQPDLPVIVITAFGTIESAVEALQAGAIDYITKPFEEEKLKLAIEKGLKIQRLLAENRQLRRKVESQWGLDNIITRSGAMNNAINLARQVADSTANVIVYGESGTGKELITRGIHMAGSRASGPFVAVNCAAIPDNLLESELFGHEKGAFTGATKTKPGKFEMADNGTLFLDEIGDLSSNVQAKVLRAIENKEIQRVGGTVLIKVNLRFIAATNKNLQEEVAKGSFREDLYFRLNVFPILLPPLRERPEDIMPLIEHFVEKFCVQMGKRVPEIPESTIEMLMDDTWSGNVRELQNTIERAVILLQDDKLHADLLRKTSGSVMHPAALPSRSEYMVPESGFSLEKHERSLIEQVLRRSHFKKAAAARMLGLSRATLRYRMEKFGLSDHDSSNA